MAAGWVSGGHVDETSAETTHDLLLALAGRVDDDLLAWARELVAVDEGQHAIELVTATLAADRTELPEPVRAALVLAAMSARTELDVAAALSPGCDENGTDHRFAAGEVDLVSDALSALPARLLSGCRVHLTRRLTPAGSAPGPLPHPIVIVEVEPGTRPRDVLTYQLTVALERAGVRASVEVVTADGDVPAYHAAALRGAVPARLGEAERPPQVPHDNVRALVTSREPRPAEQRRREPRPHPGPGHQPAAAEVGLRGQLEQPALASLLGPEVREAEPHRDPSPPSGAEGEWSQDWSSGDWAMSDTDIGDARADLRPGWGQDDELAGTQEAPPPPRPVLRPSARHRFATGAFERVVRQPDRSGGDAGDRPGADPVAEGDGPGPDAPAATTTGPIATVPESPGATAPQPEATGPDARAPQTPVPDAEESAATRPGATEPYVTGPDSAAPRVTEPATTGVEATGPQIPFPPARPATASWSPPAEAASETPRPARPIEPRPVAGPSLAIRPVPVQTGPATRPAAARQGTVRAGSTPPIAPAPIAPAPIAPVPVETQQQDAAGTGPTPSGTRPAPLAQATDDVPGPRTPDRLAAERPVSWPAPAEFWSGGAPAEPAAARSTPNGGEPSLDDLGLRPESVARLSASDRELLQRLQAELLQGRGPRQGDSPVRGGAAIASPAGDDPGGSESRTGPHARVDPPNLAG